MSTDAATSRTRLAIPVLAGLLSYAAFVSMYAWASEAVEYGVWIVCMGVGGFASGYLSPAPAWVSGLVVAGMTPVCAFVLGALTGELATPSRSTGGMVAVFIGTVITVLVSAVPLAASFPGAMERGAPPRVDSR